MLSSEENFLEVNVNKPCAFGELVVNDEGVYIRKLRRVSNDWVLFESIHRGSYNSPVRFPSTYISFEAIERFFWKLCPNLFVFIVYVTKNDSWSSKANLFSRIGFRKSHWRATKENSLIKKNLIFESRCSFCFCFPAKNPVSHQSDVWRKANWSQKTFSSLKNSQRVQYANHCWNNSERQPTVKAFERGNYL